MNVSFGKSKEKAQQTAKSQTDPWDVAIPHITNLLSKTSAPSAEVGPTADQTAAYGQLKENAAAGNPYAGDIDTLTKDLFGSTNYAPQVASGYSDLERRLTPTAEGANLDIGNDPYLQSLLKTVGDDAQWRINSMFAGAGRDLSGINQQAVGRGVTQAQAPILVDQLNREKTRTDAAIRDLFGGSRDAATTQAGLDAATADLRRAGIDTGEAALAARDYGPNTIIDLEEQIKKMPYEELSWLAELLYPAAGLGEQTTGESTSVKKGTSFGGKADAGSSIAALISALSDVRAKTDIERVGALADGQLVYRFRYIGDPVMQIGLMAQEVENIVPTAVMEYGGLKFVDYETATDAAAAMLRGEGAAP